MSAPASHERRVAVGRLAAARRYTPNDPEVIEREEQLLRELQLSDHVRQVVESSPPLRPEAALRIAELLIRGAARHSEAAQHTPEQLMRRTAPRSERAS